MVKTQFNAGGSATSQAGGSDRCKQPIRKRIGEQKAAYSPLLHLSFFSLRKNPILTKSKWAHFCPRQKSGTWEKMTDENTAGFLRNPVSIFSYFFFLPHFCFHSEAKRLVIAWSKKRPRLKANFRWTPSFLLPIFLATFLEAVLAVK